MSRVLFGVASEWQRGAERDRCLAALASISDSLEMDVVFVLETAGVMAPQRHDELLMLPQTLADSPSEAFRNFFRWAFDQGDWEYLFMCNDSECANISPLLSLAPSQEVEMVGPSLGNEDSVGLLMTHQDLAHLLQAGDAIDGGASRVEDKHQICFARFRRWLLHGASANSPNPVQPANLFAPSPENRSLLNTCLAASAKRPSRAIPPYDFSDRYEEVFKQPEWSLDRRHVFWIHDLLMLGVFQRTLEIGPLHGAATTAFIEALNRGRRFDAHFCDTYLTESYYRVAVKCYTPHKIHSHQLSSVSVLRDHGPFDFVLVDGCHSLATVTEEAQLLLSQRTMCVVAHDTSAEASGYNEVAGPSLLKQLFQAAPGYLCLEDNAKRPGESTHRGLFVATNCRSLFGRIQRSYRTRCLEQA